MSVKLDNLPSDSLFKKLKIFPFFYTALVTNAYFMIYSAKFFLAVIPQFLSLQLIFPSYEQLLCILSLNFIDFELFQEFFSVILKADSTILKSLQSSRSNS